MGRLSEPVRYGTSEAARLLAVLTFAAATHGTADSAARIQNLTEDRPSSPLARTDTRENSNDYVNDVVASSRGAASAFDLRPHGQLERSTTPQEEVIGELRGVLLLKENWDGEGAQASNESSIRQAVDFVRLIGSNLWIPESMLHPSGRAGLFWNDNGIYADLEFTGTGFVTYYVERDGGKHKGVVPFDGKRMPRVFSTLLVV